MTGYTFERLSSENLKHLVFLYKSCFGQVVSVDFLKMKYDTARFGAENIGFLAFSDHDNSPAAYYGVFPLLFHCKGNVVLAAQSGDTMTHPLHQGKGLFVKLASLCYELAKREGIQFVFGFPNKNSYPGFINKLNWKHVSDVNTFSIRTGSLPFDKLSKRISFFRAIHESYINLFLRKRITSEFPVNNSMSLNPNSCAVIHDRKFFEYKTYFKHYLIELGGVKCFFRIDGRFWVGDIDYLSKEAFICFISDLKKLSRKLGCSTIQFSVSNDIFYEGYLKELATMTAINPLGVLMLDKNEQIPKLEFQAIDFDTF